MSLSTNIVVLTNAIAIIVKVNTNWVSIPRRHMSVDGTNLIQQWMHSVETNTIREEVTPIVIYRTNRTILSYSRMLMDQTNAPTRWMEVGMPPLPEAPGQRSKQ